MEPVVLIQFHRILSLIFLLMILYGHYLERKAYKSRKELYKEMEENIEIQKINSKIVEREINELRRTTKKFNESHDKNSFKEQPHAKR